MDEEDSDDMYMEMDADDVVIEEVDTEDLLENEISQFRIVTPDESTITCNPNLTRSSVIASTSSYTAQPILPEQEENLIKRLINGEINFSDYNAQMGVLDDVIIDEPDEIVEEEIEEPEPVTTTATSNSNNDFTDELFQSRRDAFRGNLTGRSVNKDGKFTRRRCMLPPALQVSSRFDF